MRRALVLLLCTLAFAQQQEILRPTSDIDPGKLTNLGCSTIGNVASSTMKLSYDAAGLTTGSSLQVSGDSNASHSSTRSFLNWQSTSNAYSALTLNINAQFSGSGSGTGCVKYSIDGGSTYTTAHCDSANGFARQTYTFTLSATQNLSKLRVSACGFGGKGNAHAEIDPGDEEITIYDIWTSGTNPSPASGNGSTAGQAHRAVVVSN